MTPTRYDAIIIGGGHNGLVAAAYLARAGRRVAVLERRHVLGGCSTTESLWPGFRVSTAAYVISLFLPQIIRELRLRQYGLPTLPPAPSSSTPLLDGRSLTLGRDAAKTRQQIAQFSARDAERYPRYNAWLERVAERIEPILERPAPDPFSPSREWRKLGIGKRMRDTRALWDAYQSFTALGEDLPESIELLAGPARPLLERWFESEVLRATLATDAVIGSFSSISAPGTAYVLLHHVMGTAGGSRGVWGFVQGGMGGLAESLASACRDMGVEIFTEYPVQRIAVERGRVVGVVGEDGRLIESTVGASSVDAHTTFLRLLTSADLPEAFRAAVERIDYASASAKINLALGEAPRFTAATNPEEALRGTIHISPTLNYIERAYADALCGTPSENPILEMTVPTSVDRTIAPDGKHIVSLFVQYAPYRLGEGSWDELKEPFADRCIELLGRYAPNLPSAVEHRQVLSPLDLERTYGLTGGNIMQGAMVPHQLFSLRPVAGWADHRTPVRGLYLCGAASHPGGGVMGACGKNAVDEILRDGE